MTHGTLLPVRLGPSFMITQIGSVEVMQAQPFIMINSGFHADIMVVVSFRIYGSVKLKLMV